MMRTAISPRFATRTSANGALGGARHPALWGSVSLRKDTITERDVAVLLLRVRVPLVGEHLEPADEARARLRWPDHFVDVAPGGGDVRVVESGLVFANESGALGGRVVGLAERFLEDDVDGALGAHHRDLGRRPGKVQVAADVLAAHDVVGAAVRLAGDDRQLRDRRLAVGIQELGAVLDDAAVLLVDAGHEARHVDERDDAEH